jgi:hypothetical protein
MVYAEVRTVNPSIAHQLQISVLHERLLHLQVHDLGHGHVLEQMAEQIQLNVVPIRVLMELVEQLTDDQQYGQPLLQIFVL